MHPECAAYASTYCRCLGSAAAANCVQNITNECNTYEYDVCPGRPACVVNENCATGWVDRCSKVPC
jgi:hypothetical protein